LEFLIYSMHDTYPTNFILLYLTSLVILMKSTKYELPYYSAFYSLLLLPLY
jgi:hypothetical protein